uniref:Uncharacterized protein n=1 Tax=Rhizophora mucronata TaxID=61149 RepID=A0A2P2R1Y6_RHIMU
MVIAKGYSQVNKQQKHRICTFTRKHIQMQN